jgi:alanyl-tRNA synthetase
VPASLRLVSERVLVDHLKALYLLVADGAPPPGKDGRERIIRRLIRAVITRQLLLGIESESFLPAVIHHIARTTPITGASTAAHEQRLTAYVGREARCFRQTIERGQRQLQHMIQTDNQRRLSGRDVVYLEKQCGLPRPLLDRLFHQAGAQFSEAEYQTALQTWAHARHH